MPKTRFFPLSSNELTQAKNQGEMKQSLKSTIHQKQTSLGRAEIKASLFATPAPPPEAETRIPDTGSPAAHERRTCNARTADKHKAPLATPHDPAAEVPCQPPLPPQQ
jgi:hypothetical protein